MENDVDSDVFRITQNTLGKYVKRPPLSEKLLKKPPFRFLHDIVSSVLKTTGFFEGLFEPDELISENVKDRESKIQFLTKVIAVVGLTTGKTLPIKPSKIVAGQEVEKTNLLLQTIAEAIDKKLSSKEAVKKYKESYKIQNTPPPPAQSFKDDKQVPASNKKEPPKKPKETTRITSSQSPKSPKVPKSPKGPKSPKAPKSPKGPKGSDKLTKSNSEKSLIRPEKPKTKTDKATTKIERVPIKTDKSTLKTERPISKTEKSSINKVKQKENTKTTKDLGKKPITSPKEVQTPRKLDDTISIGVGIEPSVQDAIIQHQIIAVQTTLINDKPKEIFLEERDNDEKLSNSTQEKHDVEKQVPTEDDLNASLSSIDLMQINSSALDEKNNDKKHDDDQVEDTTNQVGSSSNLSPVSEAEKDKAILRSQWSKDRGDSVENKREKEIFSANPLSIRKVENKVKTSRPASVRPSSSRPGAPRPREKNESIINEPENILVGKVNIITESAPNEEDEDSSIVIVDSAIEEQNQEPSDAINLSSNDHGHLVQQILDSQKELAQASKTEIEWHFGAHKAREAMNLEIEKMRYNIQALSRAANPLGKLLDHVQEDVEIMRQELHQWTLTYEKTAKEVAKQKTINEESLLPLHTKLKQLDIDIEEKCNKINDLKIAIQKNSSRIDKLLATGNVQ